MMDDFEVFLGVKVPRALLALESFDPYSSETGMFTLMGGFDWLDPRAALVDFRDIAWSLACTARFNGHACPGISVAEHSLRVAARVAPAYRLEALLHDAGEAYVGDQIRPRKARLWVDEGGSGFVPFDVIESAVLGVIFEKAGLRFDGLSDAVKAADEAQLAAEFGAIDRWRADGASGKLVTSIPGLSARAWLDAVVKAWGGREL